MRLDAVALLRCPACQVPNLRSAVFEGDEQTIRDGTLWCASCGAWYPIEDQLLELLSGDLEYFDDRKSFWNRYEGRLREIGLKARQPSSSAEAQALQKTQQNHFDWYAENNLQAYSEYENTPFWRAVDRLTFAPWLKEVRPGRWLLDVGCAQGRSTSRFMDLDLNIIGFDISKHLIRQAIDRYRKGQGKAKCSFLVADGSQFPLVDGCMDYVLIYGVLHHLPDPGVACRETARVLKHEGIYFGSENNPTIFRKVFDVLQRMFPQWHEEAGPEALISRERLSQALSGSGVSLTTQTCVFLPPHLLNLVPERVAYRMLHFGDALGRRLPLLRDNGGLILIRAVRDRKADQTVLNT